MFVLSRDVISQACHYYTVVDTCLEHMTFSVVFWGARVTHVLATALHFGISAKFLNATMPRNKTLPTHP